MKQGLTKSTFVVQNLTRRRVIATRIGSAEDSVQRRRGLLDSPELDRDSGLWINPCEAVHTFGMRVPLDAVFLDKGLKVRKIAENLKPNRIAFCFAATSVLEIKAGCARLSGTECGDQLLFCPVPETTGTVRVGR
jgi:uncharacterized membrane protein (UPF0127 family)